MQLRSLVVALAIVLPACGARERPSHVQAEANFLAPYASARAGLCKGRSFELKLDDRSSWVILTLPAIHESSWRLRSCAGDLDFVLDCADAGDGFWCAAHDWPVPVTPDEGGELAHEIAAVADVAPRCPREQSCVRKKKDRCAEDGFEIRRYGDQFAPILPVSFDYATNFYEVSRCGKKRAVSVRCTVRSPFACVTNVRDVPE